MPLRVTKVVSGGQTGVDRAALDAAVERGVPYGGWCPAGGWAEDYPEPPGLLAAYPLLRETSDPDPGVRTTWNVRDSDATWVVATPDQLELSPGTRLAITLAADLDRPLLVTGPDDADRVAAWLAELPVPLVLNVAGPRESEVPGCYEPAKAAVLAVLGAAGVTAAATPSTPRRRRRCGGGRRRGCGSRRR